MAKRAGVDPRPAAWAPVPYSAADVEAVKALQNGTANDEQQRRALAWVINKAAQTYEVSFRSDAEGGDRETAMAEGRRFVGLSLVKLLNMPGDALDALRRQESKEAKHG